MRTGTSNHTGIEILENVLDSKLLKNLETLADVTEDKITITETGFKLDFDRSTATNFCRVVRYHDNIIVEFRNITDNLIQGTMDQLVFEQVIKPQEFSDVFQKVTGIYLDYI